MSLQDIVTLPWRLFFPVSQAERETCLNDVREKIDFYKPRIEERTGISLGEVAVKEYCRWPQDAYRVWRKAAEKELEINLYPAGSPQFLVAQCTFGLGKIILGSTRLLNEDLGNLGYFDNTIYVYFGFSYKFNGFDVYEQSIVHELTHHLWKNLSGKENTWGNTRTGNFKMWSEGYAQYGADKWFADLYPQDYQVNHSPRSLLYQQGKEKVEQLVAKHGKEILLRIPKEWEKLQREISLP